MEADIDSIDLAIHIRVLFYSLLHPSHIWIGGHKIPVARLSEIKDQHPTINSPKCSCIGRVVDSRTVEFRESFDVDPLVAAFLGDVDIWKAFDVYDGDCALDGAYHEPREVETAGCCFEGKFVLHLESVAGFHCPKFYEIVEA